MECPKNTLCLTPALLLVILLAVLGIVFFILKTRTLPSSVTSTTPLPPPPPPPTIMIVSPQRRDENSMMPTRQINIPTRGEPGEMQQLGVLTTHGNDKVLPLYGRQLYRGSDSWNYFSSTDKFNPIKLPVRDQRDRNCTDQLGCREVSDGDRVKVPPYGEDFMVSLYSVDSPRYLPSL